MNAKTRPLPPNLLGSPRAEADPLLDRAFVRTPDYAAVTSTTSYNFVVGRRGTGKSAIFLQARKHFASMPNVLLFAETPSEHAALDFQRMLQVGGSYRLMRAMANLCWHGHLLLWTTEQLLSLEPSVTDAVSLTDLRAYKKAHRRLFQLEASTRFVDILKRARQETTDPAALPRVVSESLGLTDPERQVGSALIDLRLRVVILYDRLDEGWEPKAPAIASLGGLSRALSHLAETGLPLHGIAFVRDNMFRALFAFDDDFSRDVEGSTLRLGWDEDALLHLVTDRLRVALELEKVENDVRVWNTLVAPELHDRTGFTACLANTLLRPRDILVLLNQAALIATRSGRHEICQDDVVRAGTHISEARLSDLYKEYQEVLPGLRALTATFAAAPAVTRRAALLPRLDAAISSPGVSPSEDDHGFPLFASSADAFRALFAVGFVGVRGREDTEYRFCHDGSGSHSDDASDDSEVMVHPAYWKALGCIPPGLSPSTLSEITDEETRVPIEMAIDVRTTAIGRLVDALDHIAMGREGSSQFEDWVFKLIRILFSDRLGNAELKPNPGALNQRDIVATIETDRGFWARVNRDYGTRQVVMEVKNYADPTPDDFRQVLSYMSREYGEFAVLIVRTTNEKLADATKARLKSLYHEQRRVILVLTSAELIRCLAKFRKNNRFDYTEDQLKKRLDALVRQIVAIRPTD